MDKPEAHSEPGTLDWKDKARRCLHWMRERPLLAVSLAALPVFLLGLDAPALNDSEGMYPEIAREMRASGDWITPHLNGTRHFDKPPLLYWLIGLAQAVLGETELSARLWLALAAWGTVPVTGAIAGTLLGPRAGWLSALAFAASIGPFIFGRMILPDPSMGFWIALAILGYVRGFVRNEKEGGAWLWLMFGAIGLASLIKGILGLGLPAAIIGLHALLSGRLKSFLSWRFLAGALLLLAIVLPWNIAVGVANPDFFGYFIIREHLLRFTGQRYPPDEFLPLPVFLALTLTWTFPWLAMVPQALGRSLARLYRFGRRSSADLLPLLWVGVIVGLFCASRSRLEYYAFSALPGFAILIGKLWDEAFAGESEGSPHGGLRLAFAFMAVLAALAALAAFMVLGPAKELVFEAIASNWRESGWVAGPEQTAVLERIRTPAIATFTGIALLSLGVLAAFRRSRTGLACGLLAGMMLPLFAMVYWGFLVMEPFMSSRPVAEIVLRSAGPNDPVVVEEPHEYQWIGGLNFYTKRMVHVLKDPKFEGVAARRREPAERFLNRTELEDLWRSDRRVLFVADPDSDIPDHLSRVAPVEILGRTGAKVVLYNGKASSEP